MRWTFDMMRSMKNCASSALALTLAIAGGLAAPLRSDASVRKDSTPPPPPSSVTLSAASYVPRSALPDTFRAEIGHADSITFVRIPAYDSPCFVAERAALEMISEKQKQQKENMNEYAREAIA